MFQNQKKSMFYQFMLIFIASLSCLTCVPGAKNIKFYEGPDLPMGKAAILSYNANFLTWSRLLPLVGLAAGLGKLTVVPAILKAIDGQSADAFQKGAFDFMLKPGPHTLTVDIEELLKARMNTMNTMKTRVYFHFLDDLESNHALDFEAKEGHKYELWLGLISAIKLKDTLYISYFSHLSIVDTTDYLSYADFISHFKENDIISAKPPGAFTLRMQDKNLVCYDGELLPEEESALLQLERGLQVTEIIGELADGTKLVTGGLGLGRAFSELTIVLKPGTYKLKASYFSYGSNYTALSETDAVANFTAEAGRKYQVKYINLGGDKWSLIIE